MRRGGGQGREDCSREGRGNALHGGSSAVRPTPERHGPSPPPRHRRAPRGGLEGQEQRGEPLQSRPSARRRRPWPWHLRRLVRQTRKRDELPRWGESFLQ